ncbi:MAG: selenide, water dikinase SelD [Anaerolineaceae bacterium]
MNPEQEDIKLTHYTHGLGCACKLRPQALEAVISKLSPSADRSVLVGTETSDDAAVYRLTDDLAIVQTVDFFTPIVDDPYWFGAISAANSISDIYAMGGTPRFALNIVGFPSNRLPLWVLDQILKGAQDKAEEAGISIIGGHTVDDTEPKFGLAVTGIVNPERILRNNTAQPGDALILTKPIGFGIITTAAKRGLATAEEIEEAIYWMAALNNRAAEAMQTVGVHACTDVTGFGLLGHLHEMTMGSHVDAEISASSVPLLASASRLAVAGIIPGGTRDNLAYAKSFVDFDSEIRENTRFLLADAQTSGGLLISVSPERKEALLRELENNEITSAKLIGYISQTGTGRIHVSK